MSDWFHYIMMVFVAATLVTGVVLLITASSKTASVKYDYQVAGGILTATASAGIIFYLVKYLRAPAGQEYIAASRQVLKNGAQNLSRRSQALAASANNNLASLTRRSRPVPVQSDAEA